MGEPHCVDISTTIKQEFIPEEDGLLDDKILPEEQFVQQEAQNEQHIDKVI